MPRKNCAVINCSNSTQKLKNGNKKSVMSITTLAVAQAEREDCIYCIPPFKLYCFPNILRNEKLRNKWIRALKRQNKNKTQWEPSESDRALSLP